MPKNHVATPLAAAIGVAFVTGLAAAPQARAQENPFRLTQLSQGYMVASAAEGQCATSYMKEHGIQGQCGTAYMKQKAADKTMNKTAPGMAGKTMQEGNCSSKKGSKSDPKSAPEGHCVSS